MDDKTPRTENDARGERRSRARIEAVRDREAMRWIARFRFVTTDGLAERFGVTERAMRARVGRLATRGLVRLDRNYRQPTSISLSRRGYQAVGLPPRNPPRVDAQRDHELAIVRQVAYFENRADSRVEILTERECRMRESQGLGPFHVRVFGEASSRGARGQRWPDIVIVVDGEHRTAVELEFTAKYTPRLQRIIAGYFLSDYDRILFYVDNLPLARRLLQLRDAEIASYTSGRPASLGPVRLPQFDIQAWPHAAPKEAAEIRALLAARDTQQRAA